MRLGELDHCAKFCTEGLAGREFGNVNGKTAFAVDVDPSPFTDGLVGTARAGSVVGIGHFVALKSTLSIELYIPQLRREGKFAVRLGGQLVGKSGALP